MPLESRNILNNLPKIKSRLLDMNIDAERGDCGNFAIGMGNYLESKGEILDKSPYICAYENFGFAEEGEPAHCGLKWKNEIWDINGMITRKDLKNFAFNEAYPEDEENIEVIDFNASNRLLEIRQIKDDATIDAIEQAFRDIIG